MTVNGPALTLRAKYSGLTSEKGSFTMNAGTVDIDTARMSCVALSGSTARFTVNGGTLRLMLGHLSEQNNTPDVALRTSVCELERAGMKFKNDFTLDIAPAVTCAKSVIF